MLYALQLPPEGGMTSWVDLCVAYAGLPDRLKDAVEGRRAVFSYAKRLAGYQGVDVRIAGFDCLRVAKISLHGGMKFSGSEHRRIAAAALGGHS